MKSKRPKMPAIKLSLDYKFSPLFWKEDNLEIISLTASTGWFLSTNKAWMEYWQMKWV